MDDKRMINARADVKYVGDAACVECHREISESYRTHSMGRSLYPIGEDLAHPEHRAPRCFDLAHSAAV